MHPIQRIPPGESFAQVVPKLNALISGLNPLLNLSGDGRVLVNKTTAGTVISLARQPGGGGKTSAAEHAGIAGQTGIDAAYDRWHDLSADVEACWLDWDVDLRGRKVWLDVACFQGAADDAALAWTDYTWVDAVSVPATLTADFQLGAVTTAAWTATIWVVAASGKGYIAAARTSGDDPLQLWPTLRVSIAHPAPDGRCMGEPCSECGPDRLPQTIHLTFTGITYRAGCCDDGNLFSELRYKWITPPASINGAYELTQDPADACRWFVEVAASGVYGRWNGASSCTDAPDQTWTYDRILINVHRTSTGTFVDIQFQVVGESGGNWAFEAQSATQDITPTGCLFCTLANECTETYLGEEEETLSNCFAYGGSVTVAP